MKMYFNWTLTLTTRVSRSGHGLVTEWEEKPQWSTTGVWNVLIRNTWSNAFLLGELEQGGVLSAQKLYVDWEHSDCFPSRLWPDPAPRSAHGRREHSHGTPFINSWLCLTKQLLQYALEIFMNQHTHDLTKSWR